MNYRIGLYLDNDKIGWAAIRENEEGHAEHLERIGVRSFLSPKVLSMALLPVLNDACIDWLADATLGKNIALPNCANYSVKLVCLL